MHRKLRNVFTDGWGFSAEVSSLHQDGLMEFYQQGGRLPASALLKVREISSSVPDWRSKVYNGQRTTATGHGVRFAS